MSYNGTSINNSATITGKASVAIKDGAFLAVTLSASGVTLATAGSPAVGFLVPITDAVKVGDDVDVQVKDIGLARAGATVAAGALLASDANGKVITATANAFIIGMALEPATAANQIISIQICKAGYKPAGV
ncbi:MAG: DUF2190 family protein [Bacteroides sp.]